MKLLITGAAGFIGGTFTLEALKKNYEVYAIDNFINSKPEPVNQLRAFFPSTFHFKELDLINTTEILSFLNGVDIDIVIHFAALKSVPDSEKNKENYRKNNVCGTKNLLHVMDRKKIKKLLFSSSAAVYGKQKEQPVHEKMTVKPLSYYAKTKVECEALIKKRCIDANLKAICLRYFNPLGAHSEKLFFESLDAKEKNVLGKIVDVYLGRTEIFSVYGTDYPSKDGTAIRDYIHIDDLVNGHFRALTFLENMKGFELFNLGTNEGTTVLQLINSFNQVTQSKLPIKFCSRRDFDLPISFADSQKSNKILKWKAEKNIMDMCRSYLEANLI